MSCCPIVTHGGGGSGGGSPLPPLPFSVNNISSNTTLIAENQINIVDASAGAVALTLPNANTMEGEFIYIKKIDMMATVVSVIAIGGATIDGLTSQDVSFQWDSMLISSDGVNWYIL